MKLEFPAASARPVLIRSRGVRRLYIDLSLVATDTAIGDFIEPARALIQSLKDKVPVSADFTAQAAERRKVLDELTEQHKRAVTLANDAKAKTAELQHQRKAIVMTMGPDMSRQLVDLDQQLAEANVAGDSLKALTPILEDQRRAVAKDEAAVERQRGANIAPELRRLQKEAWTEITAGKVPLAQVLEQLFVIECAIRITSEGLMHGVAPGRLRSEPDDDEARPSRRNSVKPEVEDQADDDPDAEEEWEQQLDQPAREVTPEERAATKEKLAKAFGSRVKR